MTEKKLRPQNPVKTLVKLLARFKERRTQMFFVAFLIMVSCAANVAGTYLIKELLNSMLRVRDSLEEISRFATLIGIIGAVYVVGLVASYAYRRILINVNLWIMHKMRDDMFSHLEKLPVRYFAERKHGEIMSNFTNDTDALRDMLTESIPQFLTSIFMVIGILIVMLILSPLLTALILVMLVFMVIAVSVIGKGSRKYFVRQQSYVAKVNGYIEEYIEGQKVVQAFCYEDKVKEGFDGLNDDLRSAAFSAHTFANILMPIMGNLSYLNYALTAVIGAILIINGNLGIDTAEGIAIIGAFLPATRQFSMPITQLSQQLNAVLMAIAGTERMFALLESDAEIDDGRVALIQTDGGKWAWNDGEKQTPLDGNIVFKDVTFGYEEDKTVLYDISLCAKSGQKVALVGATGVGKTTITNLLNRFYNLKKGEILYDGIDLKDIKKEDLRRSLGMVLQDTHLFTGTVRDNIRFGRLEATDEEIEAAAKLANAHFFISRLPDGYDTVLTGDGSNLSQGQRQLLSIARVAVANPPVLILDEATSSIDTRTEKLIVEGLDELMKGRTVFIIAHRLSTVKNSDLIVVLEDGRVAEAGNHKELIAKRGRYYKFFNAGF